ncbi:hypothetical protein MTBBW1_1260027 [Desulfamplus magnetovallimortis]|uniref:Uncharacterized protein n=1 Tax=Desulfamplus magnetovallimortis TaxID=1246637 RepID=A0A1W1H6U9_9BACT|nr:hypothetical protein MTBBW1_1260027 [Desulfamplus magnetovallimortis]
MKKTNCFIDTGAYFPKINKDKAGLYILNIPSILVILIQTNAITFEKAIRCRF